MSKRSPVRDSGPEHNHRRFPMTRTDFAGNDSIDSRDLIEFANQLAGGDYENPDSESLAELDQDELDTFNAIVELSEDGIEDWEYGAHMIREDTFEDYAQELAEDIGAIDPNASWPLSCIDWERAARELQMDYTSVRFLGHDYYVR